MTATSSLNRATEPGTGPASSGTSKAFGQLALLAIAVSGYAIVFQTLSAFDGDGSGSAPASGHEAIFFEPTGSSPPLIYALTIYLLATRWKRLRACFGAPHAPGVAIILLGAGSLLAAWAHYSGRIELQVPALSLVLVGLAAAFAGREGARLVSYPAAFLMLALPIPHVMVNWIAYPLQLAVAKATSAIVSFVGIPATQWGDILVAHGRAFQVIESCSGLRTVITMIMAAMIYADIFSLGRRATAILIAASPLIGLLVNELRVLSMVANPYAADETIHTLQGLVMIVVGVLALAGLDRSLLRWRPFSRPESPFAQDIRDRPAGILAPATASGFAVLLATFTYSVAPWVLPPDTAPQASSFPSFVGEWRNTARRPLDYSFLGSIAFDQCALRDFQKGEDEVEIFLCSDRRANGGDRMLSRKIWVPGPGWENSDAGELTLPAWPHVVDVSIARTREEARLVVHWRVGAQSIFTEILRGALGLDRGPFRRSDRALAVRITTTLDDGIDRAKDRIVDFLEDARPILMHQAGVAEGKPRETLDARTP